MSFSKPPDMILWCPRKMFHVSRSMFSFFRNVLRLSLASGMSLCFRPLSDAWLEANNGLRPSDRVFFNRILHFSTFNKVQVNSSNIFDALRTSETKVIRKRKCSIGLQLFRSCYVSYWLTKVDRNFSVEKDTKYLENGLTLSREPTNVKDMNF